jgi:anti-sigma factor RsiW
MNCDQVFSYLDAYADGEFLDAVHTREIETHLASCPDCQSRFEAIRSLSKDVSLQATTFKAPDRLFRNIASIGVAESKRQKQPLNRQWIWSIANLAWSAGLAGVLLFSLFGREPSKSLVSELVSGHIRSMQASHLYDVPSSDKHTVKPWFQGKLDFSPDVPNLASDGFPLLGGRLDYIAGHPAAALVYARGKHKINVFVFPHSVSQLGTDGEDGYHLVRWTEHGLDYYAVSDTDALPAFRDRFISATH